MSGLAQFSSVSKAFALIWEPSVKYPTSPTASSTFVSQSICVFLRVPLHSRFSFPVRCFYVVGTTFLMGLSGFGLCSLRWFKPFLKQLKILNKFCRDHSGYLFDLLIERGYHGAAFIIKKISHTTFAEWRWRKMDRVVSGVNKFLDVLAFTPVLAIVLEYVRNSKDRQFGKAPCYSFWNASCSGCA